MRTVRLWGGVALCVVGFLIILLPGPLGWPGIPPFLLGLLLIMSASYGARRWFVQASRQDRLILGRFRGWLKRRNRARRGKA